MKKLLRISLTLAAFLALTSAPPVQAEPTPATIKRPSPAPKPKPHNTFSRDGNTFTVNGVSFTMIEVRGGTFTMGAAEQDSIAADWEKPAHEVTLPSYYIGQTEVTQALWQTVMGNNPSKHKGDNSYPVEQVSWNDVQKFISKLNNITGLRFRLPTEAEWEFAARGGTMSRGYKYSGSDNIRYVAWYKKTSGRETHPVGKKAPNELGIYDMTGNVWEWCSDWFGRYSSQSDYNPAGAGSGPYRVIRGGCAIGDAGSSSVSRRYPFVPDTRRDELGFRLAL